MTTSISGPVSRRATRLCLAVGSVIAAVATTVSCTAQRTEEQSYEITEPVTSLVIDAQAGAVTVTAGTGR